MLYMHVPLCCWRGTFISVFHLRRCVSACVRVCVNESVFALGLFSALVDEQMRLSWQRDETQICK